eukprot:1841314-Amphidinium_carterae.1
MYRMYRYGLFGAGGSAAVPSCLGSCSQPPEVRINPHPSRDAKMGGGSALNGSTMERPNHSGASVVLVGRCAFTVLPEVRCKN